MSENAAPSAGTRASTLPELDVARVKRWCAARVLHQVRVKCEVAPRHLTIVERRAPYDDEQFGPEWTTFPIARLRYTKARGEWALYWRDRHMRFHAYDERFAFAPSRDVEALLAEVDRDLTSICWG